MSGAKHSWPLKWNDAQSRGGNCGGLRVKWIRRKHIRVNRVAIARMIRRLINQRAEFIFFEPAEVATIQELGDGRGFDAPGATYSHKDSQGRCPSKPWSTNIVRADAALKEMARTVCSADFTDEFK